MTVEKVSGEMFDNFDTNAISNTVDGATPGLERDVELTIDTTTPAPSTSGDSGDSGGEQ